MTQQEILEYNKRCAEFLTISEEIENELVAYPEQQYSPLCSYANAAYICDKEDNPKNTVWNYCKFHSDWNWIKSVLEKISSLNEDDFSDETAQAFEDLLDLSLFSSKESVCGSINNFIKTIK